MKNCLCIIPARGGSKRISNKNIKDFCGKPIIAYSIEAALESEIFDEVMVSTDSEDIAEIALKYGASIPFMRNKETADDYATVDDVLVEVLQEYHAREVDYEYFACIYSTAPFVSASRLQECYEKLKVSDSAMALSVTAFSYPPQRGMVIENNLLKYNQKECYAMRSQDLESLYHDAGQYIFYRTKEFLQSGGVILDHIVPVVLNGLEVQDIDTETDWKLAELKYRLIKNVL